MPPARSSALISGGGKGLQGPSVPRSRRRWRAPNTLQSTGGGCFNPQALQPSTVQAIFPVKANLDSLPFSLFLSRFLPFFFLLSYLHVHH